MLDRYTQVGGEGCYGRNVTLVPFAFALSSTHMFSLRYTSCSVKVIIEGCESNGGTSCSNTLAGTHHVAAKYLVCADSTTKDGCALAGGAV